MMRSYSIIILIAFALLQLSCSNQSSNEKLIRSKEPVNLVGKYMGYACGDFFPQIEPIKPFDDSIDISMLDGGLRFRVPNNFESPDMINKLSIVHNQFELKGYYYFTKKSKKRFLQPQFDLIAWRPLVLHEWARNKDGEPTLNKVTLEKSGFVNSGWINSDIINSDVTSFNFGRRYDGCP